LLLFAQVYPTCTHSQRQLTQAVWLVIPAVFSGELRSDMTTVTTRVFAHKTAHYFRWKKIMLLTTFVIWPNFSYTKTNKYQISYEKYWVTEKK